MSAKCPAEIIEYAINFPTKGFERLPRLGHRCGGLLDLHGQFGDVFSHDTSSNTVGTALRSYPSSITQIGMRQRRVNPFSDTSSNKFAFRLVAQKPRAYCEPSDTPFTHRAPVSSTPIERGATANAGYFAIHGAPCVLVSTTDRLMQINVTTPP